MAFWFGDGFDLYSQVTDCGGYWDGSFGGVQSLSVSVAGRFPGSRGLVGGPNSYGTAYIYKTSSVNDAVHHVSVAQQQTTAFSGSSLGFYYVLYDGATAQCLLGFRSDGAIILMTSNGVSTIATYTSAVPAINTWNQFEIEIVIHATAGSITVRRNGNTTADFTLGSLVTAQSTNNYANKIGIGNNYSGGSHVVDDFLWRSGSSVGWLGDIRCFTRMPVTDTSVAWTRSGTTVPLTPYLTNSQSPINANQGVYMPFTATFSGTLASVAVNLFSANTGNMKCSLYASAAGSPTTVLGSATPISSPIAGNNLLTFPTPPAITAGTSYFIAFCTDTAAGYYNINSTYTNSYIRNPDTYASFPTASPTTGMNSAQNPKVYTLNITPTTIQNAQFVSEAQQDGGATYNYSSTVSQSDLYAISTIASTPSTVVGVTTRGYLQKSDAGTRNVAVQLQSGSTNVQSASTALNTTWGWVSRTDLVDPATSATWTATGVNNATIGAIVTA